MELTPAFSALVESARADRPAVALVLGSGMGEAARRVQGARTVPFADVPGLAAVTVAGHRGCVTLGTWAGRRVLVFEGRLHFYEGHPWRTVVLPVETAHFLGARVLLVTNAAGGIRGDLAPGSLMAITDHIEWTGPRSWPHPGPGAAGPARPSPYSPRLREVLHRSAGAVGLRLHQGVYAQVTGPSYETPAEVRALRAWGADAVGMSTAREVQAAHDLGMECAAVSLITNRAAGLAGQPLDHGEVLATAAGQGGRLADLLGQVLRLI